MCVCRLLLAQSALTLVFCGHAVLPGALGGSVSAHTDALALGKAACPLGRGQLCSGKNAMAQALAGKSWTCVFVIGAVDGLNHNMLLGTKPDYPWQAWLYTFVRFCVPS